MTHPVIIAGGQEHVFVNIEWFRQLLFKDVDNIVIGIRSVVKVSSKCRLPILRLEYMTGVWSMKQPGLKVQFTKSANSRPRLKGCIHEVTDTISALDEARFGIE